jgi:hypothetical protein
VTRLCAKEPQTAARERGREHPKAGPWAQRGASKRAVGLKKNKICLVLD